ncbi:unnamed protein product, partial [Tilletia caries]
YESFNAVQRQAAVHTNRGAPSKDIASRIATQETVAHWASGGVVWASEDNQLAQPGPQIEPLLNDPTVKSLRSKWLPTEDDMQEPGIVIRSEAPLLYLTDLDIIGEGRGLPAFLPAERFHNGTAIVSQAGEKCKAGDFVSIHAQSTGTRRENVYDFTVGRLVGIFLSSGAANTPLVRLELFKIKEKSKYGMAGLVGDGTHALFEGKLLLQLLNAQHDCIFCECTNDPSGAEQLQERIRTGIRIPAVHHLGVQGLFEHDRMTLSAASSSASSPLLRTYLRRAPGGPLSAEALHPRQGHDGIKLYISPDIYAFEPLRQSAENAGAVLSINLKTGDVATKLLLTVRERTMEIYGRAISKTISGKASMFGCTPADTMLSSTHSSACTVVCNSSASSRNPASTVYPAPLPSVASPWIDQIHDLEYTSHVVELLWGLITDV